MIYNNKSTDLLIPVDLLRWGCPGWCKAKNDSFLCGLARADPALALVIYLLKTCKFPVLAASSKLASLPILCSECIH